MKHTNKFKKLTAALLAASLTALNITGFASILGSSQINGYTVQIGEGTHFTHNLFYSDQKGVGQQSENYITYEPSANVFPMITNGNSLYGSTAISKETSRLEGQGLDIIGGANADFFSLQTKVPMSNAISDGKIITKDASGQDGIGILEDGTAFISYFTLASVLIKEDGSETNIYNINKYRQPYAIYMMTPEFSNETHNTTKGIDVILGSVEGEMRVGSKMTAVVESVNEYTGSIKIPDDKIVLTVDSNAPEEFYAPIAALKEGEKVTISFGVIGDSRWKNVKVGMGSVGGRLLINGKVNQNLAAGAAPRTAIGVKEDGSIILYTIDGRQSGHSYGVQLKTLANRMKELGCTDAINLDGGGSTSIVAQFPGDEAAALRNKPSDGKERAVSTFFYFVNHAEKTGELANLHLYPLSNYCLKGSSLRLSLTATDSGYHPVTVPDGVTFSIEEGKESTVSEDGLFTAHDNGTVKVYAEKDGIKTSINIVCLESPTEIKVKNTETNADVKALELKPGERITLTADAYGGYNKLTSQPQSFTWSADEAIGMIDENRTFTASNNQGTKGNIYVSAGSTSLTVPVTIKSDAQADPKAFPSIDYSFESGVLSGTISSEYKIPVQKDGIVLRADGKAIEFEFDEENGEFTANIDDTVQKITMYVTNSLGYTNFVMIYADDSNIIENPFSDTAGHWAENTLSYMYAQGIVSGEIVDSNLKFNPQKPMTRAEFAVMISNYLGLDSAEFESTVLPYTDLEAIPKWSLESFKALYSLGILKGRYVSDTESYVDPLAPITRAEAATVIARTLPNGFYKITVSSPDKSDIPPWAEDGINVLMKLGAVGGYEDGTLLPLRSLTKAEAAKILYSIM